MNGRFVELYEICQNLWRRFCSQFLQKVRVINFFAQIILIKIFFDNYKCA